MRRSILALTFLLCFSLSAQTKQSLKVDSISIEDNSIGIPQVTICLKNVSGRTIKAFKLQFRCYDDFGKQVKYYTVRSNKFIGVAQGLNLKAGAVECYLWGLYGYANTTNIKYVKITKVVFYK